MQKIIEKDEKITKVEMTRKEAEKFYEENDSSRGKLQFDLEGNEPIYMYFCGKYYNYCYGTLANRTGIIKIFDVIKYGDGFLIRYPSSKEPTKMPEFHETKKLAWALEEFEKIHSVLDVLTVYKLNKAIEEDRIKDVIMLAEALHEKKIANIADDIASRSNIPIALSCLLEKVFLKAVREAMLSGRAFRTSASGGRSRGKPAAFAAGGSATLRFADLVRYAA